MALFGTMITFCACCSIRFTVRDMPCLSRDIAEAFDCCRAACACWNWAIWSGDSVPVCPVPASGNVLVLPEADAVVVVPAGVVVVVAVVSVRPVIAGVVVPDGADGIPVVPVGGLVAGTGPKIVAVTA